MEAFCKLRGGEVFSSNVIGANMAVLGVSSVGVAASVVEPEAESEG